MNIITYGTSKPDKNKYIYAGVSITDAIHYAKGNLPAFTDYVCFYHIDSDYEFEYDKISKAVNETKADVLHGGFPNQSNSLLPLLSYYQPVWMYGISNYNPIKATNWHLNLDCLILHKEVIKQFDFTHALYDNPVYIGLEWGYRLLKGGAIVQYHQHLSNKQTPVFKENKKDNVRWMQRCVGNPWTKIAAAMSILDGVNHAGYLAHSFIQKEKKALPFFFSHVHKPVPTFSKTSQKVSVFTPTLFRYSYLEAELEQLSNQTIVPYEIIITDQTDKEQRTNRFLERFKGLNVVYEPQEEKGQCNAWNFCITHAQGDYFLFLGDDADDIYPKFIEDLLSTLHRFDADVVACNIKEGEGEYPYQQKDVFITETFPICLVKRSAFEKAGGYDYAYNKGIRADADMAMRIHQHGGLLVLNPDIKIYHHKAPVGGLRMHGERIITRAMSKMMLNKFQLPSFTEYYLFHCYFSTPQQNQMLRLKWLSMLSVHGGLVNKLKRLGYLIAALPKLRKEHKVIYHKYQQLLQHYPQIPKINPLD